MQHLILTFHNKVVRPRRSIGTHVVRVLSNALLLSTIMTETEKLIELVKERRFLYDLSDPDYKNRPRRLEGWQDIANEMGGGTATLWSTKWKGLKDNYGKFKKTSEPTPAVAYKKYKNWPWAEHLRFLDDCNYTSGKRSYAFQVNTNNSEQTQDQNFCNVHLFMPDANLASPMEELHDPVPEGSDNYASENKRRKLKYKTEPTEDFEYAQIKRNEEKPTLDGVDHFFLSYAQSFKKLPNRMQIMLKLEIATLFSRYELQAEGVTSESVDSIPRLVHPVKCELEYTNSIDD